MELVSPSAACIPSNPGLCSKTSRVFAVLGKRDWLLGGGAKDLQPASNLTKLQIPCSASLLLSTYLSTYG
jgi:hypothetical protein